MEYISKYTRIHCYALVVLISIFLMSCGEQQEMVRLSFEKTTCNYKENPTAIESDHPLLSWIVKSDGYNKSQSAYQVLVASSLDKLAKGTSDIWDSKKITSARSTFIKYGGSDLQALQTYFWKVKIWDEKGNASDWSPVQQFTMGLMGDNWGESKWITLDKDTRKSSHRFRDYKTGKMDKPYAVKGFPAGYFRKETELNKEIESAQAYIAALGYYELYLNGEKVGDHVLDPAPSNYDKQAYYVNYDIKDQLDLGKNVFGIILGNGFYGQNISWKKDPASTKDLSYGAPTVKLLVKIKYKDGTETDFYTDETWKESTGPIVFNNIYGGDTYDARYELNGWNTKDYNDEKWNAPKVVDPELKTLSAQQIPAIKKLKYLSPIHVFKASDGEWVVDFGQNIAGWIKLNVKEKEGELIEVTTTEALLTNGKDIFQGSTGGGANGMAQVFKYICKGSEVESWEPKFSYHGFRYAKIKGISTKPDADMIKAVLVATDIEVTGSFNSSDPLLNKMHNISKWTIEDNLHGIPEDCPHREKCGWLGDAHAFAEYALYNYDMYDFYSKFMEDIRTQMRPTKGRNTPETNFRVPTMIAPGKRTSTYAKIDWGVATMYLPWYSYLYYGDSSIIIDYYKDMKELTEFYLTFKGENNIMQDGMGDWCPPLWDRKNNPSAMETDPIISANAYFYDVLGIMETFAKLNNDTPYAKKMKKEKASLKEAFNTTYLTEIPLTQYKWYQSQTATVQALQFGMVPKEELENVVNGLVHDITNVKGGHHATGIHGNRYIYSVLTKYGKGDLAHQILTTADFPSQAYVMNSGFTTWPERQFEWEKMEGPTNSLNHPMHSGFSAYFYESLGGVKSSEDKPGYKVFIVDPQFPSQVTNTNVSVPTPYGNIDANWQVENEIFTLELSVPFNTTALLPVTNKQKENLTINAKDWRKTQAGIIAENEITLGSGFYIIRYNR